MQLAQVHLSRVITEMTCSSWLVCSPAQLKPPFRALPVGVPSCSFLPQWIALISMSRPFPVTSPLPHCSPTLGLKMYEWLSRSFSVRFTRLSITLYCCTFSNVVVLGEQKLFLKERIVEVYPGVLHHICFDYFLSYCKAELHTLSSIPIITFLCNSPFSNNY